MGTPYLCIHTYIAREREKQDLIYVNQLQLQLLLFSPHCVCVQRVMQMEPQPKVLNNKRQVVASRCAHEGHPCSQIYLSISISLLHLATASSGSSSWRSTRRRRSRAVAAGYTDNPSATVWFVGNFLYFFLVFCSLINWNETQRQQELQIIKSAGNMAAN